MRRLALLALLLSAGCMTTEMSHVLRDVPASAGKKHLMTVEVRNTGWFLFDFIPLVCGNPAHPDEFSSRFFSDTLTLQNNLNVMDRLLKREGASVFGSLTSHEEGEGFFTFVVTRKSFHTSATLVYPSLEECGNQQETGRTK